MKPGSLTPHLPQLRRHQVAGEQASVPWPSTCLPSVDSLPHTSSSIDPGTAGWIPGSPHSFHPPSPRQPRLGARPALPDPTSSPHPDARGVLLGAKEVVRQRWGANGTPGEAIVIVAVSGHTQSTATVTAATGSLTVGQRRKVHTSIKAMAALWVMVMVRRLESQIQSTIISVEQKHKMSPLCPSHSI